jgi:hypothetical protein
MTGALFDLFPQNQKTPGVDGGLPTIIIDDAFELLR